MVERTTIERFRFAVQEDLAVDRTVVVDHVARMLQALIRAVVCIGERYVVEGNVCTAHVLRTDVRKFYAINCARDRDILAACAKAIRTSHNNLHFIARLCHCERFCKRCIADTVHSCHCVNYAVYAAVVHNLVRFRYVTRHNVAACDGYFYRPFRRTCRYKQVDVANHFYARCDRDCTIVCLRAGIVEEYRFIRTFNLAARNRQYVFCRCAVQELTNRTIRRFDYAAVDRYGYVAKVVIRKRIDCIRHIRAAKVFNRTTVDNKRTARVVGDYRRVSAPTAVVFSRQVDCTRVFAIIDRQRTVVVDKAEVCTCRINARDYEAVQINRDRLACFNRDGAIKFDVCYKHNRRTICLLDCRSKRCIVLIANACHHHDERVAVFRYVCRVRLDGIRHACIKRVARCRNFDVRCACIRRDHNARCVCYVARKYYAFRSAYVYACIREGVARNRYGLRVLCVFVIRDCSLPVDKRGVRNRCRYVADCRTSAFPEDDCSGVRYSRATDERTVIHRKAALCGNCTELRTSRFGFAHINRQVDNRCIRFETECRKVVVIVHNVRELNRVAVTIDRYVVLGNLAARVSCIPSIIDRYVLHKLQRFACLQCLQCFFQRCIVVIASFCYRQDNAVRTIRILRRKHAIYTPFSFHRRAERTSRNCYVECIRFAKQDSAFKRTAGNNDVCLRHRRARVLRPNCAVAAFNLAAFYVDRVHIRRAVCELTNCKVGAIDFAAINVRDRITQRGVVVDCIVHRTGNRRKVFNSAADNVQRAAFVGDCIQALAIAEACTRVVHGNRTVLNRQSAFVRNQSKALCKFVKFCLQNVAAQIKRYYVALCYYNAFRKRYVAKKFHFAAYVHCFLKGCIIHAVNSRYCLHIRAIRQYREFYFFASRRHHRNRAGNRTAVYNQFANFALERCYRTARNRRHRFSTVATCRVDEADVTAGNVDCARCRCYRGHGCRLRPNCAGRTVNRTTRYVQNRFAACAVRILFHTVTDCRVRGREFAAVDRRRCVAEVVRAVIDYVRHIRATKVSKRTVFNRQYAATVVEDGGHRIPIAIVRCRQFNRTVAVYDHFTIDIEEFVICRLVIRYDHLLAVHIKRKLFAICNRVRRRIDFYVCKERDYAAVLHRCHRIFEGRIIYRHVAICNRCHELAFVGVRAAYCRKVRAVRRVFHNNFGRTDCTDDTACLVAAYRYVCNCAVRHFVAVKNKPCNTACERRRCIDGNVLHGAVFNRGVDGAIPYDTAYEAVTVDIRTFVCIDCAIANGNLGIVVITKDTAHAIYGRCVHLDITFHSDIFKRCVAVSKPCNDTYVVCFACNVCRVNRYVFNREIANRNCAVNVAEQTAANVIAAIFVRLDVQVLNRIALTIEVAIERPFVAITDAFRPFSAFQIDVCAKSHPHARCVVFRFAAVYACTEEFQIAYIINNIRIAFRTCTAKAAYRAIHAVCRFTENQACVKKRDVRVVHCGFAERTARDSACKCVYIGSADLRFKHTAAHSEIYVAVRVGDEYGRTVYTPRCERTARDNKFDIAICLNPDLAFKRTAVDEQVTTVYTNRTIGRRANLAAVNRRRCRIVALVDCAVHMYNAVSASVLFADVFYNAVFNRQRAVVCDGVRTPTEVRITSARILEADLTVARDRQVALVFNHCIGCRACLCLGNRVAVQVERYNRAACNYKRFFQFDVADNVYYAACVHRFLKRCVFYVADLRNNLLADHNLAAIYANDYTCRTAYDFRNFRCVRAGDDSDRSFKVFYAKCIYRNCAVFSNRYSKFAGRIHFYNDILDVVYRCICAVCKNQLTNVLAIHCVAFGGVVDHERCIVNRRHAVVAAVFAELNHAAREYGAVLDDYVAAVTEIRTKRNNRIIDDCVRLGSSENHLGCRRYNAVFHRDVEGRRLAAGRFRKRKLIREINDAVHKVHRERTVCARVLAGRVTNLHVCVGNVHRCVVRARDGHTARDDQGRHYRCLVSRLRIRNRTRDVERIAIAKRYAARARNFKACAFPDGDNTVVVVCAESRHLRVAYKRKVAFCVNRAVDLLAITINDNVCRDRRFFAERDVDENLHRVASFCRRKCVCEGCIHLFADLRFCVHAIDAFQGKCFIFQVNGYFAIRSRGHHAVRFIFRCTDCKPQTIRVRLCHRVRASKGKVYVCRCFANNHRDERIQCYVRKRNFCRILCIHANAVTSCTCNRYVLNRCALYRTKGQTALGVRYRYAVNRQIPAGRILQEGMQTLTSTVADNHLVCALRADSHVVHTCAFEITIFNRQVRIMVGFRCIDEIVRRAIRVDKFNVLNGQSSTIIICRQRIHLDALREDVAIPVDRNLLASRLVDNH